MTHQPTDHGPGHRPREHVAAHLPRFRGASENAGAGAAGTPQMRRRWRLVVLIAILAALFLAIVIMHTTGAMPKTGM